MCYACLRGGRFATHCLAAVLVIVTLLVCEQAVEHFYAAFSGVKRGSSTALLMVRVKAQAALAACMVRLGQGKQSMEMSTKVRVGGVAVPTCDAN